MKTFLCSHLVNLRWNGREAFANLERISRGTATVNSDEPLPVGTPVAIRAEDCELTGTVSRCVLEMSGHEIDVVLAQPWSPEIFTPEHLFDPGVMIAPRHKGL
jgi:hypothetical protein